MADLSIIILTYNEEIHIERCIKSAAQVAEKIFIVDSFSSDTTVEKAMALGADVVQHEFVNYAKQFDWAINNLPINTKWTMRLDADEYLEPALQKELPGLLETLSNNIKGVYIKRKVYFLGKWMHYGGFYPLYLLRIWRSGEGRIENRWMDEHIVLSNNTGTIIAKNDLVDDNGKGLTFWIDKHNRYASREALDILNTKYPLLEKDLALTQADDPQAKRKRVIKEGFYKRLPLGFRAFVYFIYRYIFLLGFLDGAKGFIWHFLQGFWYRFLVDMKIYELEQKSGGKMEKLVALFEELHDIKLDPPKGA
ncbi:MAG: glycosyltransferase family 2 protein [Anaerolineales bacterium]|nr:glycosyltransferase family 2 protein [Anaerolineales bacterium]